MMHLSKPVVAGAVVILCASAPAAADRWIPLSGEWRFALDQKDEGVAAGWQSTTLADRIQLPGTTDEARKGPENPAREPDRLTRLHPYVGPAWYQRDLDVPASWRGKRVTLTLERTKSSRLWLDAALLGSRDSLTTAQQYALGTLTPGRHRLTLRIDNAEHAPLGDPHQLSDHTQTNWNGVIGKLDLAASDSVWIEDVQVYPDFAARRARVRIEIGNATGSKTQGALTLQATPTSGGAAFAAQQAPFAIDAATGVVDVEYVLGADARGWDELSPETYRLSVALAPGVGTQSCADERVVTFGLRDFKARGTQLSINGKTVFLRGRADNCVFPMTGYPPMTVDGWLRVFRIAKEWGLNHFRFHTWCPPAAAFEAADQLGIYLQPELPNWKGFGEAAHDDFLRAEGERILRAYGNHPSFVMFSLGNELGGRQQLMAPFVKHFQELDPRHLYAQGTNNWFPGPGVTDDYYASFQVAGKKVRGSYATVDPPLGHVQVGPPSTTKDYTAEISSLALPVVSHEIGEYQVAPDLKEITKYRGVVRARNLELFRERLAERGLLAQAADFQRASGALAVACYREDIEAALRTRGFGGFQLLDLVDFPGQGTALVGVLDAFMDSKGLIEPARWREFCSATVPLLRFEKYTWTRGEVFKAKAEAAHYGAADLQGIVPVWTLRDAARRTVSAGKLPAVDVPQGTLATLGEIEIPLRDVAAPGRFTLELALSGTAFRNRYDIWVYPDAVDTTASTRILLSRSLDDDTRRTLLAGGRVLLLPQLETLGNSLPGMFAPDFWNYGMFRKFSEERKMPVSPGTLGILCDPKHPSLSLFPTDFHTDWQWFHLLQASRAVIVDALPASYRPLVQVIDNYERAHRLGVVFELKVGKGALLVCAIDLLGQQQRPEARQLLNSLLSYAASADFAPTTQVDEATLTRILAQ
jgi:hypothetical protein